MSQSPVVALYLAHLEQRSGLLEILSGAHSTRIHLQRGRVVQVEDMPGLLEELVPHGIGSLRDDLAKAIQGGAPMPQAFETAARDIGRALALTHGQDGVEANFNPDGEPPPGCFPLEQGIPEILRLGFTAERPPVAVYREYRALLDHRARPTGREAKGLGTHALRLLRGARQSPLVSELMAGVPQDDPSWVALDLLVAIDALVIEEVKEDPLKAERLRRLKAKAQRLEELAIELSKQPPLTALGIQPAESMDWLNEEGIAQQYRKVATPYHPDQIAKMPAPYRAAASAVFSAYSEIKERLLKDPQLLKDEKERLVCEAKGRLYVPRGARDEARACFKRAQGHEHYRQWEQAQQELEVAVERDPSEPLYAVVLAFVKAVRKQRSPTDAIGDIREVSAKAGIIPRVEGLYRIGRLFKMAESPKDALSTFQDLLHIAPNHVGAKREVRLLKKRLGA